jgi:peptidoglycan glycosyltransferase
MVSTRAVHVSSSAAAGTPPSHLPRRLRWLWRRARRSKAWLEIRQGEQLLSRHELGAELNEERLRIGRAPLCELQVEADGVSRVHAFVEKERPGDRDWWLEDFDSANGLFLGDRRIRAVALRDGDVVTLGSPLRDAPRLEYHHPRSAWERLVHGVGVVALAGSAMVVGGLMLASTVGGGSRVAFLGGPVKIVSAQGQRIDEREGAMTALPSLEDYPLHLRQALLASEDARFGWNSGLDFGGMARSLLRGSGGGSGISQQVARMVYPWVRNGNPASPWPWVRLPETDAQGRTSRWGILARKIRELPVAWQLETRYGKNKILKLYLDRAYLGMGSEGFEEAARLYFRKSARDLTLPESAYLVGLLPSPNAYNVCLAPTPAQLAAERLERERASGRPEKPAADESIWTPKLRRDLVLRRMLAEGFISETQYRDAIRHPLRSDRSICRESLYRSYPFFSDYVRAELAGPRYSLNLDSNREGGNYRAEATINPTLQGLAEETVRRFLERDAAPFGVSQAALISVEVSSGRILAYVGGRTFGHNIEQGESSFDRVRAERQPGSTFKLFTFLAALSQGLGPATPVSCAPVHQLQTGCRRGGDSMAMRDGFAFSENPVALHLADRVGYDAVIKMARRLGVSSPHLEPNASMVLGGNEVLLYEMARAYAVVANGGRSVGVHGVARIHDLTICGSELALGSCPAHGVFTPLGETLQQLLAPGVARSMDSMLRQAVVAGTGKEAAAVADARGKTGTTNDGIDVWFIGYSPSRGVLTGIWMGNDDNRIPDGASGSLAARLWATYMRQV